MAETEDAAHGEAEYRAIEATFGESARGRWFLAEFARRSRRADLAAMLAAMDRLREGAPARKDANAEALKTAIAEMAAAIAQGVPDGFEGVAAALREAENATSDILDAAEHIQELAWTMRERGADRGICDLLDNRSSEIYAACALHDAAAKRVAEAVQIGGLLEERITSLRDSWGVRKPDPGAAPVVSMAVATPEPDASAPMPVTDDTAAPEPAEAAAPVAPAAAPPAPIPEPAPELSAAERRQQQLAVLADIDSLGTREKLKLFT